MSPNPYVKFLPTARQRAGSIAPEHTYWPWRGHSVHIARARNPQARTRLLVVHGAGGYSGALWPIASLLADEGFDVASVDLPLYGLTHTPRPRDVEYGHWVRLLLDLVAAEDDGRPLILLGASIGGMLAYEVASRSPHVAAAAVTCLLDPQDTRARMRMTRFGPLGALSGLLTRLIVGPLPRIMIPISLVADLAKMSRNPALSRLCASDPLGGGAKVPLGFLKSYLHYRHTNPARARTPITLVHPALDDWTPASLSVRVLDRIAAPTNLVMLRECGHFPVEEPGLGDLIAAVRQAANAS